MKKEEFEQLQKDIDTFKRLAEKLEIPYSPNGTIFDKLQEDKG